MGPSVLEILFCVVVACVIVGADIWSIRRQDKREKDCQRADER